MSRPRVVIAGLGESGLLTAVKLAKKADVVGISSKPAIVSGQELGLRLTRPNDWARDNWISFDRYRGLDQVRTVHGALTGVDLDARTVQVAGADGSTTSEPYDVLVISTGVTNGFWRRPGIEGPDEIGAGIRSAHEQLAAASSVIVVGGGAAAVSSAMNAAKTWPETKVDLYFPGERALPHHHPRVWDRLERQLVGFGVGVHPGHRAELPAAIDQITDEPVRWSTGQPEAHADAVLWTIGKVAPNTAWLPAELLDENGFVVVTPELKVPGHEGLYAIGDVAATDPLRTSARNRADLLLAHNVLADLDGKPLKSYKPRRGRWGSVVGIQENGLEVFAPSGKPFRFPSWTIDSVLMPLIVRKGIYGGVRAKR